MKDRVWQKIEMTLLSTSARGERDLKVNDYSRQRIQERGPAPL